MRGEITRGSECRIRATLRQGSPAGIGSNGVRLRKPAVPVEHHQRLSRPDLPNPQSRRKPMRFFASAGVPQGASGNLHYAMQHVMQRGLVCTSSHSLNICDCAILTIKSGTGHGKLVLDLGIQLGARLLCSRQRCVCTNSSQSNSAYPSSAHFVRCRFEMTAADAHSRHELCVFEFPVRGCPKAMHLSRRLEARKTHEVDRLERVDCRRYPPKK